MSSGPAQPPPLLSPRARVVLGRVLRYALPYWKTMAAALLLMAVYGGANSVRLFMVGLLCDGLLVPASGGAERGKAVRFYDRHIAPFLPRSMRLSASRRIGYEARALRLASGRLTEESEEEGGWRGTYEGGALEEVTLASGEVLGEVAFHRLELRLAARPPQRAPPFTTGPAELLVVPSILGVLVVFAAIGVILAIVIALSNFGREYLAQSIVVQTIAAIRRAIFHHLSGLSLSYFSSRRSGELISRLTNDVAVIQLSLRYFFGELLLHPLTIAFSLAIACYHSWQLTLIVIPFLPVLLVPLLRSGRRVKKHGRGSLVKLGEVTETMNQLLSGIRVVKAFGMERAQWRDFDAKTDGFIRANLRMIRAKVTARSAIEGLYNLLAALVVLFGGWLVAEQWFPITFGDFATFLAAILSMYQPMRAISRAYNTIQESLAGAERVFELLEERPAVGDRPGAAPFVRFSGKITFDEVSFRYGPEEPWVLRRVSFVVGRGETVALVGPSGAGKSTLLDLLARFHDAVEGRVLIDGVDLRDGTHASLLAQIAIVGQDPFLFHTTIEENIRFGKPDATREEVEEAARAAAIHDEIMATPEGYQTVIGERGMKLSGGQRQRLTIARAILKNPEILILDEATSALDSESERKVQAALANLMEGRTTLVIAHRLSTIQHADRILVMEEGRIVESGSHEELMALGGSYARLQRLQETAAVGSGKSIEREE